MSQIIIPIWNTPENDRFQYSYDTIQSVLDTTDLRRHRLTLVDNGSTDSRTEEMYGHLADVSGVSVHRIGLNKGTAAAVNVGLRMRMDGENCIKLDSDCKIHRHDWVDEMDEAIDREPRIGILGLKRVDLEETPWHELEHYRSTVFMLPHERGQSWILVEQVRMVMGTCTMFNPALLDKIGFMRQTTQYGLDDYDISIRSTQAGFINVFLPSVPISHIDTGENLEYMKWKGDQAAIAWPKMQELGMGYINGTENLYYDGN